MTSAVLSSIKPHLPLDGATSTDTTTTTTTTSDSDAQTTAATTTTATATSSPPSLCLSVSGASKAATISGSRSRSGASPSDRSTSTNTSLKSPGGASACSPRIVYGAGAISRLPTELGSLCSTAPLIVSSPSRISLARRVQALIPNLGSAILDSALINVPQHIVDDAVARINSRDAVISVGGASAMKLAKTIAIRKQIPHICIPTTYSGSEMPLLGDSRRRKEHRHRRSSLSGSGSASSKRSADTDHSMPTIIIYDEDLTNTNTSMTISVPYDTNLWTDSQLRSNKDDSQWSYIHLPGV